MPNKKAQRKAAALGTTVEARREARQRKAEARTEEALVERVMNDPETIESLRGAIEESKSFGDLWDNPMVRAAREQMTPEQIAHYERLGREMYGTLDFENINESKAEDDGNAEEYIVTALRSGLRPCDLEDDEQAFMADLHGPQWYDQYGGYGCPLPGANAGEVVAARHKREDSFLQEFGGKRMDFIKELNGNR